MKKDGFHGQELIVFPQNIQLKLSLHPLSRSLYLTDIGYFPQAHEHLVQRDHRSAEYIYIHCLSGRGWIQMNGDKRFIEKNHYIVIPPHAPHTYGTEQGQKWEIIWMHYKGDRAEEVSQQLCYERFGSPIPFQHVMLTLDLFHDILRGSQYGFTLESAIHASMKTWHYFSDVMFYPSPEESKDQSMITIALNYMQEQLELSPSLDQMAEQAGVSPVYFSKIFKQKMKFSPMDYFIRLKIQRSCKYLRLSDLKIKDISERMGYTDPYYFSRIFKKVMGVSPLRYRVDRGSANA
jgi:AraC family transcriptional regulator, arabinose operon regulatory protein